MGGQRVAHGARGSSQGASGPTSGIFREIPGRLLAAFWTHFPCCFGCLSGSVFLLIFEANLHRFLYHFGSVFGVFFWCFPKFAKNAAPHESSVNSNKIVVRAAAKTTKIH